MGAWLAERHRPRDSWSVHAARSSRRRGHRRAASRSTLTDGDAARGRRRRQLHRAPLATCAATRTRWCSTCSPPAPSSPGRTDMGLATDATVGSLGPRTAGPDVDPRADAAWSALGVHRRPGDPGPGRRAGRGDHRRLPGQDPAPPARRLRPAGERITRGRRLYDAALARILRVQTGGRRSSRAAVAADPDFALGHAALALLGHEWVRRRRRRARSLAAAHAVAGRADERERRSSASFPTASSSGCPVGRAR